MFVLILFLIFGSILAYLSQHNLMPVSVHVGPYIFSNIPLFYVIIGSLVVGLVFSYIIYLAHDLSVFWILRGKDKKLRKDRDEVLELTKRVHQLELENEKLKNRSHAELQDRNAL